MIGTAILQKFNVQVDDASELSDAEALDLANDVYNEIADDRPWEWLRATFSGSTSTSVPYIALPSDFKYVLPNYSGLSSGAFNNLGAPHGYTPSVSTNPANIAVVFVGSNYTPYRIIPYGERHNYRSTDGYCYIDVPNSRLVFTLQPTSVETVEYDYIKIPPAITASTAPLFREGFHKIIAFGMASKFNPIEQTDKASSYQRENRDTYNDLLADMGVEDAQIKLSYA